MFAAKSENILGVSAQAGDAAACLVMDGAVHAAAREAWFTRRRGESAFPAHAIQFCLDEGGLEADVLDCVVFCQPDAPGKAEGFRRLWKALPGAKAIAPAPPDSEKRNEDHAAFARAFGPPAKPAAVSSFDALAAAAGHGTPWEEAAVLILDSGGGTSGAWGGGRKTKGRVDVHSLAAAGHAPSELARGAAAFLGLDPVLDMDHFFVLASLGRPSLARRVKEAALIVEDGRIVGVRPEYAEGAVDSETLAAHWREIAGGPRRDERGAALGEREMDFAASVQEALATAALDATRRLHAETGRPRAACAGDLFRYGAITQRLMQDGPFKDWWIQPAARGASAALGAALSAWRARAGGKAALAPPTPFLGPWFGGEAIASFLEEERIPHRLLTEDGAAAQAAELLADGAVVGWFQDRMAVTPGGFGVRSVLCDPRARDVRERLNREVRQRPDYTPFTAIIAAEHARECFAVQENAPSAPVTAALQPKYTGRLTKKQKKARGLAQLRLLESAFPGVTQPGPAARVHVIRREEHPRLHALLRRFHGLTGCPVLLHAALQPPGEPVACSPRDAYRAFMLTALDYLVAGAFLLDKRKQPLAEDAALTEAS